MTNYTFSQDESYTDTYTPYNSIPPSQKTLSEIEEFSNVESTENIALRSAPPGGTPIGGVPLEDVSIVTLIVPFLIYFIIIKRRKLLAFFH